MWTVSGPFSWLMILSFLRGKEVSHYFYQSEMNMTCIHWKHPANTTFAAFVYLQCCKTRKEQSRDFYTVQWSHSEVCFLMFLMGTLSLCTHRFLNLAWTAVSSMCCRVSRTNCAKSVLLDRHYAAHFHRDQGKGICNKEGRVCSVAKYIVMESRHSDYYLKQ